MGPILFWIYINNLCCNVTNIYNFFYADDTIIYSSASSLLSATKDLLSAFNVQQNLQELRLNTDKTKIICFSRRKTSDFNDYQIDTLNNNATERVKNYNYLSIFLEENLSFEQYIGWITKKLRMKLGHLKLESQITMNNYKSRIKDYLITNCTFPELIIDLLTMEFILCCDLYHCVLCLVFYFKSEFCFLNVKSETFMFSCCLLSMDFLGK